VKTYIDCIRCGICIGKSPLDVLGEEFSMRGLIAIMDRIASNKRVTRKEINILLSALTYTHYKDLCPLEIDMSTSLSLLYRDLLKEKLNLQGDPQYFSLRRFTTKMNGMALVLPKYRLKMANKVYRHVSEWVEELEEQISLIINIDISRFYYCDTLEPLLMENNMNKLNEELKANDIVKVCAIDDATHYILQKHIDLPFVSLREIIIDSIEKAKLLFKRQVTGNAIMLLPLSQMDNKDCIKSYERIMDIIPDLSVVEYPFAPDLPPLGVSRDFNKKYYEHIVDYSIKKRVTYVISTSIYMYELLTQASTGHPIIPVYLPYLIMLLTS